MDELPELKQAVDNIKRAQQVHKCELEKKDEVIQTLQERVDKLQSDNKRHSDWRRLNEKKIRELVSANKDLAYQVSVQTLENDNLKEELVHLRQDISTQADKVAHLESEHDKANQIIKNLLKRLQVKPAQPHQMQQQPHQMQQPAHQQARTFYHDTDVHNINIHNIKR